ncbi:MAG: hypothetical protein OXR73_26065 [Myxococcales bacterium]|nr:hypothetical protein [Myxococcales bacterium]
MARLPEDVLNLACPACGLGRPLEEPIAGPSSACPEACGCIPEHFSLAEHEAYVRHQDEHDRAKQAKGDVN